MTVATLCFEPVAGAVVLKQVTSRVSGQRAGAAKKTAFMNQDTLHVYPKSTILPYRNTQ